MTIALIKTEGDILSSSLQHIPSVDECNHMSADVLHKNLEASLVGTFVCYAAAKNLVVVAKIRMQGGEKIGGCLTFTGPGGYVDTYLRKPDQSLDAAVRGAYRLLDGLGIDEKFDGSPARKQKTKSTKSSSKTSAIKITDSEFLAMFEGSLFEEASSARATPEFIEVTFTFESDAEAVVFANTLKCGEQFMKKLAAAKAKS